jgi:predicted DNA-binding protein (MmcQ/YjbR family)
MTHKTFRRIALSLNGAIEASHMGHPDFRVANKIFASLHPDLKSGMVKLTPDQQKTFICEESTSFAPESGAWGRSGCTRVTLATVDEDSLGQALTLAWQNIAANKPSVQPKKKGAKTVARSRK